MVTVVRDKCLQTWAWFYEWLSDIQVCLAGWLKTRAKKISTYSMIHHNKVLGRGWWCHWWWWGSHLWVREEKEEEEMEEEEEDKEKRWVKKGAHGEVGYLLCVTHGNRQCWPADDSPLLYQPHTRTHIIHRDAHVIRHDTHTCKNTSCKAAMQPASWH